ncbi:MAG: hypothetical protein PHP92_03810 [Candidatus Nanoarchaeia archaeon]|nr:hypothetical protein [Candidatus Nanoarchaeia archaeon]
MKIKIVRRGWVTKVNKENLLMALKDTIDEYMHDQPFYPIGKNIGSEQKTKLIIKLKY